MPCCAVCLLSVVITQPGCQLLILCELLHHSVGVVVYHRDMNSLLIVRQFRPPVYIALQQEVCCKQQLPVCTVVQLLHTQWWRSFNLLAKSCVCYIVLLPKQAEKLGKPPPGLEAAFTYELTAVRLKTAGLESRQCCMLHATVICIITTHGTCLAQGIIDKDTSLQEIAADEVLEECGFRVDPADVKPLASYHAAIGFSGESRCIASGRDMFIA